MKCTNYDVEKRDGQDFRMCDKGRAANKWGICGKSSVEEKPVSDSLCKACEEKKKKKKKDKQLR
ncbi:hypothetical protein ACHAPY_011670 [Fusarium culmorum]